MSNVDQISQFLRKSQKTHFLPLFVQNGLKIDKNSKKKKNFELHFGLLIRCCFFSFLPIFADILSSMPNKAKK